MSRGTVIRLFSPEGTLVVEIDDPGVSVKIDGSDVSITGAGAGQIRLKPGRYTVKGVKDGKIVAQELVTITKDGKRVVRVSREAPPSSAATAEARAQRENADATTNDPDRRAAEYVLSIGGMVKVNDQDQEIKVAADLPGESFRLTGVRAEDNKQVTDAGLVRFKDCKNLTSLVLWGTHLTDAGMVHFKDLPGLRELSTDEYADTRRGPGELPGLQGPDSIHGEPHEGG